MDKLKTKVTMKRWWEVLISILFFIINCVPVSCYALDSPPITSVDEFFVQNGSGIPPVPDNWHLTIGGAVNTPLSLTMEDLMSYPSTTVMATLECYSLRTDLIGNANWTGIPLHTIIEQAGPLGEAQSINFYALDGYALRGFSLNDMLQRNDIILAYKINGEMLPPEQGHPLRLVLPGSYGYQWLQWVDSIEITTTSPTRSLTVFPLHAKIFNPKNEETIGRCTHTISGMAFVGEGREIIKVEISLDEGTTWEPAQLLNYFVPNVWKFWEFTWVIPQDGLYQIFARVEDNLGNIQESYFMGYWGWHALGINVSVSTCEGDLDHSGAVDGVDTNLYKQDYGRNPFHFRPCTNLDPCHGDLNCSGAVDGVDTNLYKQDYGRNPLNNPCPACSGYTCVYP